VVPPRWPGRVGDRHGDQLLPAQLRARLQRRRVVQPAAAALRHGAAGVGADRRLPGRDRAGAVPPRALQAPRRGPVHGQRQGLLRARARHQRGRRRRRARHGRQGHQLRWMDAHVQELGRQLAVPGVPQRAGALVPGHRRRWADRRVRRRRAAVVDVRADVREQAAVQVDHMGMGWAELIEVVGRGVLCWWVSVTVSLAARLRVLSPTQTLSLLVKL